MQLYPQATYKLLYTYMHGRTYLQEAHGYLHTVISGVLQEEGEHLKSHQLMEDLLVDQVSQKLDSCYTGVLQWGRKSRGHPVIAY